MQRKYHSGVLETYHVTRSLYKLKTRPFSRDDFDINLSRCVSNQGTDLAHAANQICARFRHTCEIYLTISEKFRWSEYMETTSQPALECLLDMLNGHCFVGQWWIVCLKHYSMILVYIGHIKLPHIGISLIVRGTNFAYSTYTFLQTIYLPCGWTCSFQFAYRRCRGSCSCRLAYSRCRDSCSSQLAYRHCRWMCSFQLANRSFRYTCSLQLEYRCCRRMC